MQDTSSKDITKVILILAGTTVLIPTLIAFPGLGYALKPLLKSRFFPSRIDQTIGRLQRQKLISVSEQNGQTKIELTEAGRKKVLKFKIKEMVLKKSKWDGWWRVVVFDIPEKKKQARNFLRTKMRELGFYMLQKSVFVTPWECRDEVDFIKHYYGVGNNICLIRAKHFDEEELVKNFFELS